MKKIVIVNVLTFLLLTCKQESPELEKVNEKNMNTVVTKQSKRIKGTQGYLYVVESGKGNMPVIFLHSFGGNSSHWEYQMDQLDETRRVVAFDFRGHGNSDNPANEDYSAEALSKDLEMVVNSLGMGRFVLVGHSMGGTAAAAYAGKYPDRVAGLVLVGTPGKSDEKQAMAVIASLESEQYQQVMDDYMHQLLEDAKPEVDSAIMRGIGKISRNASIDIIKSIFAYDPTPSIKNYTGPVLIISTSREEKNPASLHHQLPEVPVETIDGTSHWVQMDKPDEFNEILDGFLDTVRY